MARGTTVKCRGKACEHWRKSYATQKYFGGELPNFALTEERCAHPNITPEGDYWKEGIRIGALSTCPNGETNEA
jgi:hypothetical protein